MRVDFNRVNPFCILVHILLIPYFCFVCVGRCCGFHLGYYPRLGATRGARREYERIKNVRRCQKQRRRNEPKPLRRRRRALSSSPFRDNSQSSPLLHLPTEIRRQIFTKVVGHSVLHLVQLPKRLGHIRCSGFRIDVGTAPFNDIPRDCFAPATVQTYRHDELLDLAARSDGSLALLQTCRQIYTESVTLLYTANTFDINHAQTLIYLSRTILLSRFESIRSMQLTWTGRRFTPYHFDDPAHDAFRAPDDKATWESMLDIVGKRMKALRNLKLRLGYCVEYPEFPWQVQLPSDAQEKLEVMLQSLRLRVKGLDKFELEIVGEGWETERLERETRHVVCMK